MFNCPVCDLEWDTNDATKHHLVPKSRKGKETVLICSLCHKQIHALFTEKELEREYDTIEKLKAAESIQTWIKWHRNRNGKRQDAANG